MNTKPKVELINTQRAFGVNIETDHGMCYRELLGTAYSTPIFWMFQGRQYMLVSDYFRGEADIKSYVAYELKE